MSGHRPQPQTDQRAYARAQHSFWLLVVIATLATGGLSRALTAPPGPLTGMSVAGSGLILVVSLSLAVRVMVATDRARRRLSRDKDQGPSR